MTKNNPLVRQIVDDVYAGTPASLKETVGAVISEKAMEALEMKKVEVAKSFFGQLEEENLNESGPTRKHFRDVANTLKAIENPEKRKELAQHHAEIFKRQNPRFDHKKFYDAAGVDY